MRGVNDKNFFNLWQMLFRRTCPGFESTCWHVDDVEWRKDRHSFSGGDYSFASDVHCLTKSSTKGPDWQLLVVIEYWWDRDRETLRSTTWARVLSGSQKAIVSWLYRQTRSFEGLVTMEMAKHDPADGAE